jgi:uncharacterized damage-inducible protein DinB
LDFRPKEGVRSVRELLMHMYTMERTLAENIRSGKLTAVDADNPGDGAGKAVLAETEDGN